MTRSRSFVTLLALAACSPFPPTNPPAADARRSAVLGDRTPNDAIRGEVEVMIGDSHGGDWSALMDDEASPLRLAMQGCYARTLLAAPSTHGWLSGEITSRPAGISVRIVQSGGLPSDLLACIADACEIVPLIGDEALPARLSLYASMR